MLGAVIGDLSAQWDTPGGYPIIGRPPLERSKRLLERDRAELGLSLASLAAGKAIIECGGNWAKLGVCYLAHLRAYLGARPDSPFGNAFRNWLLEGKIKPRNSFDIEAVMGALPCALIAETEVEAIRLAQKVAKKTHSCPDVLKGAEAYAVVTFMAKDGATLGEIKDRVQRDYYKLDFDAFDELSPFGLWHDDSPLPSGGTLVQLAIKAFVGSTSFEGAILDALQNICPNPEASRLAVMVGGMAEAYYGIPELTKIGIRTRLDQDTRSVRAKWETMCRKKYQPKQFGFLTKYIHKLGDRERRAEFGKEFPNFSMEQSGYRFGDFERILEQHGLAWESKSMRSADIENMSLPCTLALLAAVVRAEHYSVGVLDEFARDGLIEAWLKHVSSFDGARGMAVADESVPVRVEIGLLPMKGTDVQGGVCTLNVTQTGVTLSIADEEYGSSKHSYEFGPSFEYGGICMKALEDCLRAEGWAEDQSATPALAPNVRFYKLEAEYADGSTICHSGAFDRAHVPEKEFQAFAEAVKKTIGSFGQGAILEMEGFMDTLRPGEVKYCGVEFVKGGKLYHYRTADLRIGVGDTVLIPVGHDDVQREAIVKTVVFTRWDKALHPLEKTKTVSKLVSKAGSGSV